MEMSIGKVVGGCLVVMKKKWLGITLCVLALGVSIAGCGSGEEKADAEINTEINTDTEEDAQEDILGTGEEEEKEEADQQKEEDAYLTVGFLQSGEDSAWKQAVAASMEDAFSEENGYTLEIKDAGTDQEKQVELMEDFFAEKVDYIAAVLDGESQEILLRAKEEQIPVILLGNPIKVKDDTLYTAWLGPDYLQEGYDAADWLLEYAEEKESAENKVENIALVVQDSPDQAAEEHFLGFFEQKEFAGVDNWSFFSGEGELILKNDTKNQEDFIIPLSELKTILKSDTAVDVLVCENNQTAVKAVKAAQKAGRTLNPEELTCGTITEKERAIKIISFGKTEEIADDIKEKKISAGIESDTEYGTYVEEIIQSLQKGEEIDKIQYVDDTVVDLESLSEEE
jgi:simple sugar transport system substrate-binding protein